MADCYIFCAGEWDGGAVLPGAGDLILAADGGLKHCEALGLKPDLILGDFDSLGSVPSGAEVYPVEKDDTDAMLAARRAVERGCSRCFFLASLDGSRLDHTVANFQTLQWLLDRGIDGYLVGKYQMAALLPAGTYRFPREAAGDISLFAWNGPAEGVTLEGLHYGLENGSLTPGHPLGVSNHFTGRKAAIRIQKGTILAIWTRQKILPERI